MSETTSYDVFLSYSIADVEWVAGLVKDLKARQIKTFFDRDQLQAGDKWIPALAKAIENSGTFIVIVSPKSHKSKWVEEECSTALALNNREKNPKRIIPVLYQKAPLPGFIGTRQAIDFIKKRDYQVSLESLAWMIKPGVSGNATPGDGRWIEYKASELRRYREDLGRVVRYLLDAQTAGREWFHATRYASVATAQIIELLSRVRVQMRQLKSGARPAASRLDASISGAFNWLAEELNKSGDDFSRMGDDLWDRGFIARSMLYATVHGVVKQPSAEALRSRRFFQLFLSDLKAEQTRQPWEQSTASEWPGAGFLGPVLLVARWMGDKEWESQITEKLNEYVNKDTESLGAMDTHYYPWHAGNVVEALNETGLPLKDKSRRNILQQLERPLKRSNRDGVWAAGMPPREQSMINNWGVIALLLLYGPNHRTVHRILSHFQERFLGDGIFRFDDAKTTVCYGQALYSFLCRHDKPAIWLPDVVEEVIKRKQT